MQIETAISGGLAVMDGKITKETATEYQKRSVESRNKNTAERKAFKEWMDSVLNEGTEYNGETISKKKLIAIKALKYLLDENELSAHEFARMFEIVRDTIGEKPVERVEQLNIDAEYEQSVEYVRKLMENE